MSKKREIIKKLSRISQILERIYTSFLNIIRKGKVFYIVEQANWVIRNEGLSITKNIHSIGTTLLITASGLRNRIIHYGSINTILGTDSVKLPHKSNKIIITWFHVVPKDPRLGLIDKFDNKVSIWHTASQATKKDLLSIGIDERKIVVIPLGVNLKIFNKPSENQKRMIRLKLGIPDDAVAIGSFQKDGIGLEEGLKPKLIKGPDIFCDVVEQLSKNIKIFIVLTGPARGYVKDRLNRSRIPFCHTYVKNADDVAYYYKAIDLYIITSRVEGGPKAVLESLASGVPLVSTDVGMVPDIIKNGSNGIICGVDETEDIVKQCLSMINNQSQKEKLINSGLDTVSNYGYDKIAPIYNKLLYQPLL